MIVFGLGAALPATKRLAAVLNGPEGWICFHELNPSCMRYEGTPQPVRNTVQEFRAILAGGDRRYLTVDHTRPDAVARYEELLAAGPVSLLGDVAHYYLRYVDEIAEYAPEAHFVCVQIDREAAVAAWEWKAAVRRWPARVVADRIASWILRAPYYRTQNYWVRHDGSYWKPDPLWDKLFPDYPDAPVAEVVRRYWEEYYAEAERLAGELGPRFRRVALQELESEAGGTRLVEALTGEAVAPGVVE
ncbi:MAG: hypothetical protein D6739_07345 [Nitrospirae bacterium]|nr:MAG: hypothetical protein D6739_07345 [Nitrospirota bacterium]